jgi:hypothetical protein
MGSFPASASAASLPACRGAVCAALMLQKAAIAREAQHTVVSQRLRLYGFIIFFYPSSTGIPMRFSH